MSNPNQLGMSEVYNSAHEVFRAHKGNLGLSFNRLDGEMALHPEIVSDFKATNRRLMGIPVDRKGYLVAFALAHIDVQRGGFVYDDEI